MKVFSMLLAMLAMKVCAMRLDVSTDDNETFSFDADSSTHIWEVKYSKAPNLNYKLPSFWARSIKKKKLTSLRARQSSEVAGG